MNLKPFFIIIYNLMNILMYFSFFGEIYNYKIFYKNNLLN